MTTITGLTAERMLEIEAASVVDGDVVGNDLILTKHDGSIINAGNVRGVQGPVGPMGASLPVLQALLNREVGEVGQVRAGRQLTVSDFTNMGYAVPLGLWNLSNNSNDSSGNGRHMVNKGGIPFGVGINGLAATAAVFSGLTTQALYLPDTGAGDPLRSRVGSWGFWMRTAKRGLAFDLLGKGGSALGNSQFLFELSTTGYMNWFLYDGTTSYQMAGYTDLTDDRWHFIVGTFDGHTRKMYVDGLLENQNPLVTLLNAAPTAPLNIGGRLGDASTATTAPAYGRVDEVFQLSDILTDDGVRNLYCASVGHALATTPIMFGLSSRRRRRGGALATTDFPSQPLRLYNFVNGAMTDQGSSNIALAPISGGSIADGPGPDGSTLNAKIFSGTHQGLVSSDAGLPSGLATRSYGMWFNIAAATVTVVQGLLSWGTYGGQDIRIQLTTGPEGALACLCGSDNILTPRVADGLWHHICVVEDNAEPQGLKRKAYLDGRLVGSSTVMNSIDVTNAANRFHVAINSGNNSPLLGNNTVSRVFVHNIALTTEQVRAIYNVGPLLAPTPRAAEDFIEASETGRLLATFDMIDNAEVLDLAVMA